MRKNDTSRMTIVEQIVSVREEICDYACKYREEVYDTCRNESMLSQNECDYESIAKVYLKRYCDDCPMAKLHYVELKNEVLNDKFAENP